MDESPARYAAVCVDHPLPQLNQLFDYRIPAELLDRVEPGCRVAVRFSNRRLKGTVLAVRDHADFSGTILPILDVLPPGRVLTAEVAGLAQRIADRYAGNLADVLRLALPERKVRVEKEPPAERLPVDPPTSTHWDRYNAGEAFLRAVREGKAPRIVWSALPGEDWTSRLAEAAAAAAAAGRGALLVVPDQYDLERLDRALTAVLGPDRHVTLSNAMGPTPRYRSFLKALRGEVRIVAGTQVAMFAPVDDLGLVAVWDDGDQNLVSLHAPHPHAREVLLTRAELAGAACAVGGFARTAQAQLLVETGWAVSAAGRRDALRAAAPRVVPIGDDADLAIDPSSSTARLPSVAWEAARKALGADLPVLLQVPRRGYVPAVSCQRCRARALCPECTGPLRLTGPRRPPVCTWCGRVDGSHRCAECGSDRIRAVVIGAGRTAEEVASAFPGVEVVESNASERLDSVPEGARVVVSTPGVEPVAPRGYGAVLLVDTWAQLTRAELTASEEALRIWMNAVALCAPGGTAVVTADGGLPVVQALIRWDAAWFAGQELEDRAELGFPPVMKFAALTGPNGEPEKLAADLPADLGVEAIGPIPVDERTERLLLRVRRRDGAALAGTLARATAERAGARAEQVRVQIDPREIA
ncbi:primosome assembly protein PriA [Glycomyces sp. A-F 0318]|uniref:primosomal protein N' family DNA-binding protein n=1 Tax=Glycomyces amatae TaxID=2881355 RepID=UPI001E503041|nr:primosome assembly protein PriA [Glycomyces amatae]MCD0446701.1 primosome assembly protein PriA [Glycomyces amatae]